MTTLKALSTIPSPNLVAFLGMPIVKLSTTPHASILCRGSSAKNLVYRAQSPAASAAAEKAPIRL